MDHEKTFYQVQRRVTEWSFKKQKVPEGLATAVMSLYVGTKSQVSTIAGMSEEFEIGVGLTRD